MEGNSTNRVYPMEQEDSGSGSFPSDASSLPAAQSDDYNENSDYDSVDDTELDVAKDTGPATSHVCKEEEQHGNATDIGNTAGMIQSLKVSSSHVENPKTTDTSEAPAVPSTAAEANAALPAAATEEKAVSSADGSKMAPTDTFEKPSTPSNHKEGKRFSIPIPMLSLNPTPDMLEQYSEFYDLAHALLSTHQVEPHESLSGGTRLLRFLIGYHFNIDAAIEAYKKHIVWLKSVDGDTIVRKYIMENMLSQPQPENAPQHKKILKHFPMNMLLRNEAGDTLRDNENNILCIERPGYIDEKRFTAEVSDAEVLLWHIYQLEFRSMLLDSLSNKENTFVKTTVIIDLSGFSSRSMNRRTINLLRQSVFLAAENYPETMSHIFFVNTPKVFSTLWNMLKGWLNERTLQKVHILDFAFEDTLYKFISKESLPVFLFGVNTFEMASVPAGGFLAEDRYGLGPDRSSLSVPPRKKEALSFAVTAGTVVYWAWALQDSDIGFSVKLSKTSAPDTHKKANDQIVVDFSRHDSSRTIRGVITAPADGVLQFIWDNSWSLLSSRVIHYLITIGSEEKEEMPLSEEKEEMPLSEEKEEMPLS